MTSAPSLLSGVDCLILAGGLGTRLRMEIGEQQKVAAAIDGQPFIGRLLQWLGGQGVRRAILAVGYRADDVTTAIAPFSHGIELVVSKEEASLGTAGALRLALPHLHSQNIVVLNGDSFFNIALATLCGFHKQTGAAVTMALARVADATRYGRVELDPDGRVSVFREKNPAATGPGVVNAGVYIMKRDIIAAMPAARSISLETEVLPGLCGEGRIYGVVGKGRLVDIGTPESFRAAAEALSIEGLA